MKFKVIATRYERSSAEVDIEADSPDQAPDKTMDLHYAEQGLDYSQYEEGFAPDHFVVVAPDGTRYEYDDRDQLDPTAMREALQAVLQWSEKGGDLGAVLHLVRCAVGDAAPVARHPVPVP